VQRRAFPSARKGPRRPLLPSFKQKRCRASHVSPCVVPPIAGQADDLKRVISDFGNDIRELFSQLNAAASQRRASDEAARKAAMKAQEEAAETRRVYAASTSRRRRRDSRTGLCHRAGMSKVLPDAALN
jgi:hypothetical protein